MRTLRFPGELRSCVLRADEAGYREPGHRSGSDYFGGDSLTEEFETETLNLVREHKGDGEYLSVHHLDEPVAKDDAPDSPALPFLAAAAGGIGEILFL